jgi:hypothetical protein
MFKRPKPVTYEMVGEKLERAKQVAELALVLAGSSAAAQLLCEGAKGLLKMTEAKNGAPR